MTSMCRLQLMILLAVVGTHNNQVWAVEEPQASSWSIYDAKDYLVTKIKDKLIYSGGFKESLDETLARIEDRFEEEKLIDPNADLEALQFKIAAEEIKQLRAKIEQGSKDDTDMIASLISIDPKLVDDCCRSQLDDSDDLDEGILACKKCQTTAIHPNLLKQKAIAEEEETELINKLDDLDGPEDSSSSLSSDLDQAGKVWPMSEEIKAVLKKRTKKLMLELLAHELKQLVITLYISRTARVPLSPMVIILTTTIQIKILDFMMNCLCDLVPSLFGIKQDDSQPPLHWTTKIFG